MGGGYELNLLDSRRRIVEGLKVLVNVWVGEFLSYLWNY